jgi:hypothetical protein
MFQAIFKDYIFSAKEYDIDINDINAIKSGLICVVFFSTLPISGIPDWKIIYEKILSLVFLYLKVDTYLDSPDVDISEKIEFSQRLAHDNNSLDHVLKKLYSNLVKSDIDADIFSNIVNTTLSSFRIQYSKSSTLSLLKCSIDKGGAAVLSGYRLIYQQHGPKSFISDDQLWILGGCVQLLDDIMDCTRDQKDGILTIATYIVKKHIYLDNLAVYLETLVSKLVHPLLFHALIIRYILKKVINRSSYFSPQFRTSLGLSRYKS